MSIIQEFLEQNLNHQISPSLEMQIQNIRQSYSCMLQQLTYSKQSIDKHQVIKQERQKAQSIINCLNLFKSQINSGTFEIDMEQLIQLITEEGENQEWVQYFIKSKRKQMMNTLAQKIRSVVESSKSNFNTESLHTYVNLLEQIQTIIEKNKEVNPKIIAQADNAKFRFASELNLLSMKQLMIESLNRFVKNIRQIINKLNNSFDKELKRESNQQKLITQSPLKILKERPSSRLQTPVKEPQQQKYYAATAHQFFKPTLNQEQSYYPYKMGKQKFSYLSDMY